jgi:hypothetical protein
MNSDTQLTLLKEAILDLGAALALLEKAREHTRNREQKAARGSVMAAHSLTGDVYTALKTLKSEEG